MRAGLPRTVVQKLALSGGAVSFRYALVDGEGVYQASQGSGATWQAVDRDLPSRRWNNVQVRTITVDPSNPNVVYVGMGGAGSRDPARSAGLYVTNDGGRTWQSPVKSIAGEEVQVVAVMPHAPARGGTEYLPEALAAGNSGPTQTAIAFGETSAGRPAGRDSNSSDSVVCAATVGAIYCNTGVSQSWVRLDWRGTEKVLSMAIRPDDPSTIYIGTAGFGLVSTTDGGGTWKQSHVELQDRQVYDIVIPVTSPDVLYVGTDDGLFESTNAGSTWTRQSGPTEGRRVNTIVLCPDVVGSDSTIAFGEISAAVSRDKAVLCVGLQHGAVYRSVDGGRNWVPLNKGLGSMTILSLAIDPQDPSVLWAGTTDGVWRYGLPVAQGGVVTSPSPSARPQPSPTMGLQASPTMTPVATLVSRSSPEPTPSLTRTARPTATPTPSRSAATMTPTPTATSTKPAVTRAVPASPTNTRTPSPIPTNTEAPLPPPGPTKPRPTATRVPR